MASAGTSVSCCGFLKIVSHMVKISRASCGYLFFRYIRAVSVYSVILSFCLCNLGDMLPRSTCRSGVKTLFLKSKKDSNFYLSDAYVTEN